MIDKVYEPDEMSVDERMAQAREFCFKKIHAHPHHLGYKFLYELLGSQKETGNFIRANSLKDVKPSYLDNQKSSVLKDELKLNPVQRRMLDKAATEDYLQEDRANGDKLTRRQMLRTSVERARLGATIAIPVATGIAAYNISGDDVKKTEAAQAKIEAEADRILERSEQKRTEAYQEISTGHREEADRLLDQADSLENLLSARRQTAQDHVKEAKGKYRMAIATEIGIGTVATLLANAVGMAVTHRVDRGINELSQKHRELTYIPNNDGLLIIDRIANAIAPHLERQLQPAAREPGC